LTTVVERVRYKHYVLTCAIVFSSVL